MEYSSISVIQKQGPEVSELSYSSSKSPCVRGGKAQFICGQRELWVSIEGGGQVSAYDPPVPGKKYRITGTSGLNLIGTYLGRSGNSRLAPLRFELRN
jgi:hypothetical protein